MSFLRFVTYGMIFHTMGYVLAFLGGLLLGIFELY